MPRSTKAAATATTPEAPAMRRCSGAALIQVEAHEAPVADFPIQPSQKDGLGRMCKPHWNAYTRALRVNAQARAKAAGEAPTPAAEAPAPVVRTKAAPKPSQAAKAPRAARAPKPVDPAKAERIAKAKALVAEVDALPAPEAVKRAGDDDVQAALRVVATASVGAEHSAPEGEEVATA